ncbi:hypothetical protein AMECASPLE_037220 [Ameca splendens]|uniref:Uncharacterized protein n=1 Tax=Ameca splendens TaxID=208324 RepID=A0ABV0YJC9_9TELE
MSPQQQYNRSSCPNKECFKLFSYSKPILSGSSPPSCPPSVYDPGLFLSLLPKLDPPINPSLHSISYAFSTLINTTATVSLLTWAFLISSSKHKIGSIVPLPIQL